MLAFFAVNPLITAFCIGAFLCGVAIFHTVMLRTYTKRRDEEQDAAQA